LLELRPAALVEASLVELLRQLGEAVTGREGMQVEVVVAGSAQLQPDVHVVFYRVAQEALNNVVKHARANQVRVLLSCTSESEGGETVAAKLTIRDDGRGFDPGCPTADCLGLRIMRERAESIRAGLRIASSPGDGTEIRLDWQNDRHEPAGTDHKD
jgi:signal transduction histidine kinase